MEHVRSLIELLKVRLKKVAGGNAVVAKPVSVGDRHVVPLCELGITFGGGGGEGRTKRGPAGSGAGALVGGGAKATPVAVVVIEGDQVRIEKVGR